MILEEFVGYYHKNKNKKKQVKEILLNWLKTELTSIPQKNYQKVIHNELVLQDERIVPKNKQGENLLSSLLRITSILEEKEFETWAGGNVKTKECIHA